MFATASSTLPLPTASADPMKASGCLASTTVTGSISQATTRRAPRICAATARIPEPEPISSTTMRGWTSRSSDSRHNCVDSCAPVPKAIPGFTWMRKRPNGVGSSTPFGDKKKARAYANGVQFCARFGNPVARLLRLGASGPGRELPHQSSRLDVAVKECAQPARAGRQVRSR